jgi:hypothetical protein
VFTSSPQSVEIYERGAWWPGSMLGWRHDNSGSCQAWVRVEFAGVVEDAWVDLTLLRLPESSADRHLAMAREPRGASRGDARDGMPARPSDVTQTQHLPLVREGGAPAAGRRVPPTGGRRRAPETGEMSAPAAPPSALPAAADESLGRHRAPAPADPGRHRAADTGVLSAVPAEPGPVSLSGRSTDRWAPAPSRTELPPAGPAVRSTASHRPAQPDLLTRPMRLEDGVGSARRSRRDTLTGV